AAGVVDVLEIAAAGRHGIAVVARSYWQARKAQQLLKIEWQTPANAPSDASVWRQYEQDLDQDSGDTLRNDGNFRRAAKQASRQLQAEYRLPYLAHATLEPQVCVVSANRHGMEVWAPTQAPSLARIAAAKHSRYSVDSILVHTTWIGGGFG